jgi:DNA-binding CsgD family transcriptional regulator
MGPVAGRRPLGRDAELAAIDAFIATPWGGPRSLVLEGPAGIGKSTLWLAAVERFAGTLLACRPAEEEAALSYAGVADLLDDVEPALLDVLPEVQRDALTALLVRTPSKGFAVDERTVGQAVLSVVRSLSAAGPVVLAVDDMQWLDVSSARTLRYVLRRLGEEPVGILVARRPEAAEPVERIVEGRVVTLGPLDLDILAETIAARVGERLLLPVIVQLHRASEGNPFVAIEMARALVQQDEPPLPGAPLPVPSDLRLLVEARVATLTEEARRLVELVAIAGQPSLELLREALGHALEGALDEAVRHDVLEQRGRRLACVHPLLAAAVRANTPPVRARGHHLALGRVAPDLERRARHLALATPTPDPSIAALLDEAAHEARGRGAPAVAAELLDLALGLDPVAVGGEDAEPRHPTRFLHAAEAHIAAGNAARGADLLERGLEVCPPGSVRARLLHRLADHLCWTDQVRGLALFVEAIAEAGESALASSIEQELAWVLAPVGRVTDGVRHAEHAVGLAEAAGEPEVLAGSLARLATLGFMHGRGRDDALVDRAERERGAAPAPTQDPVLHARLIQSLWSDDFAEARSCLDVLDRQARHLGDEYELLAASWYRLLADLRQGRWDALADTLARDRGRRALIGMEEDDPPGLWIEALVLAHLGEHDQARTLAERGAAMLDDDDIFGIGCRAVLGLLAMMEGDAPAAVDHLAGLPERARRSGWGEPGFLRWAPDVVEAHLLVGDVAAAEEVARWFGTMATTSRNHWALAVVPRLEGLLLAARRESDAGAEALAASLAAHEGLDQPFELARTRLLAGALERRRKRKGPARELLQRARDGFAALPAPRWAARAEDELARLGGRPSTPDALTPTEHQVATHVAAGRTNREVADALFVSPKTVEWNLSKVYRKLGVRSRAELAARWPSVGGPINPGGPPGS